ncbi:ankyrin repeat domain-containing protein 33B [Salmo salar]|uniref:Ankyrin repeat domain-containing protein 33B n=1 Tax=Salmo salar TaxID=8030 RepID=A0A1S3LYB3_SALSA|nr:ankyrin repeat domain-containing protein 33B-like [Salmo salar]|eukprot:XP_013995855.1 PREDICTED: ankyrin repeat domain-containing protein 33B-like [Salmo salar]
MVLIIEDSGGGGGTLLKVQQNGISGGQAGAVMGPINEELKTVAGDNNEDPNVGDNEDNNYYDDDDDDVYQEFEEFDFNTLPDRPEDTRSIASDDSFYPPDESLKYRSPGPVTPEPLSFFMACSNNNSIIVKIMIRQGVTEEEVRETDKNNRNGLIVACYMGWVDVVIALSQCPHIDVNWQDNEGNTALMTAAQAGHIMISSYLINYFSNLDLERRNCHGFTAMMKAAMQGRADVVRLLMLSGADVEARDYGRKMTSREWALFTCRYETAYLMMRLMAQPCAEQFCESYKLEWPMLQELVAQGQEPKNCWQKVADKACCRFSLRMKTDPVDDGVMDHMVRITTALSSPLIATACNTVALRSPPCIGKRRYAVPEILRKQRVDELKRLGPDRINNYKKLFNNSRVQLVPKKTDRRASLQTQMLQEVAVAGTSVLRRASLLPLNMMRRSSVRPGIVIPKVRLCKAPSGPTSEKRRKSKDPALLQLPKWRYKQAKEERRRQEEEEKQRRFPTVRRR